jgi:hypothetical protein
MWWPICKRIMENNLFSSNNICRGPLRGVNPKKNGISKVLATICCCVSRNLNHHKRNQLNPITPPKENVRNVHKYWNILTLAQNSKIGPHIVHFLLAGWPDWADFFCNESGFLRHKFRLPTTYYSENFEITLFLGLTLPWGTPNNICRWKKHIFRYSFIYWSPH